MTANIITVKRTTELPNPMEILNAIPDSGTVYVYERAVGRIIARAIIDAPRNIIPPIINGNIILESIRQGADDDSTVVRNGIRKT